MPPDAEPRAETVLDARRPDVHNSEVDLSLASRQLCGMTHLNTGHVCLLPERHPGGCDFVRRPDVRTD